MGVMGLQFNYLTVVLFTVLFMIIGMYLGVRKSISKKGGREVDDSKE